MNTIERKISELLFFIGVKLSKVADIKIETRLKVGLSMIVASVYHMYVTTNTEAAIYASVIGASISSLGLFVIVPDVDVLNKGVEKVCIEILKIIAVLTSTRILINGTYPKLILAVCVFIDIAYIVSMIICIFKLVKKLINFMVHKIKLDAVENNTKRISEIFKNLTSILGVLAVIYQFFMPVIEKLLGM